MAVLLLIIFSLFYIGLVNGADSVNTDCQPNMVAYVSDDIPEIEVAAEHKHRSITNGLPYGPVNKASTTITMNSKNTHVRTVFQASRGNIQNVTIAYNGSHICAASQFLIDIEIASKTNITTVCDSTCFLASQKYKVHTLQIFKSFTSSTSIGEWQMFDYVEIYTKEILNKELSCYYLRNGYDVFRDEYFVAPTPNVTKCPIGQRCRISVGKYTVSSFPKVFVGCETDKIHEYDGCKEGCTSRQVRPDGYIVNWATMCRYCCSKDFCNSPQKCNGVTCDLQKTLEPNLGTMLMSSVSVMQVLFIIHALNRSF